MAGLRLRARMPLIAILGAAAAAVGLWLSFGVGAGEVARFVAYQAVGVLLPGVLVLRLLRPRATLLEQAALGWAVGYALEILVFVVAAAAGVRDWLPLYPALAVAALIVVAARKRTRAGDRSPGGLDARGRSMPNAGLLALMFALMFAYVAVAYYSQTPLPGTFHAVDYDKDSVYWLSLAGEAKHQWPLGDPNVVGERLPYHWFAFIDLAATSKATGIELATLLFRLQLVPMLAALFLLLTLCARRLSRGAAAAPIAVALVLFVGELDLDAEHVFLFRNAFFTRYLFDPGILLGALFFTAATLLLWERVRPGPERARAGWREWLLLAIVLAGCSGAKGVILPVLLGGLGLYAAYRLVIERRLPGGVLGCAALAAVVLVGAYGLLYRGAADQLTIEPLATFDRGAVESLWSVAVQYVPGLDRLPALKWPFALVLGTVGLMGPMLAGLAFAVRRRRLQIGGAWAWLLSLLVAGALLTYVLREGGNSQEFFLLYGYVAGALVAAGGLAALLERHRDRSALARFGVPAAWLALAAALGLATTYLVDLSAGGLYAVQFGSLALALGLAWIATRRRPGIAAAVVVTGVLAVGALDAPLDYVPPVVEAVAQSKVVHSTANRNLTPGILGGLRWLRDNTGDEAVLAANNQARDAAGGDLRYFYYSAFAERPVFLEGSGYANVGPAEVARRRELNRRAFETVDRDAICMLVRDYHVTHFVADRVHGRAATSLAKLGRQVFANGDIEVRAADLTACPAPRPAP